MRTFFLFRFFKIIRFRVVLDSKSGVPQAFPIPDGVDSLVCIREIVSEIESRNYKIWLQLKGLLFHQVQILGGAIAPERKIVDFFAG